MSGTKGIKRVKSGCITCRVRRVKCDEEHPSCRRCTSTGRKCDGYSTLPFSRKDLQAASRSVSPHPTTLDAASSQADLIPRLVTDPAFEDLAEKRYFQFFRQKSVISNNNLVDNHFWDRVVLQACHSEPAIKHAVLALSCLHQLGQMPRDSDVAIQHEAYAERQHQKALSAAQHLISTSQAHDFDKILTACVIFILFESVRGDYQTAAMHMRSGRAILAQHSDKLKRPGRRKDLLEIEHALGRLDLAAVSFSDSSSPNEFSVAEFHSTGPSTIPYAFEDIHDAQTCLVDLCRWLLVVAHHVYHTERNGDVATMARYQAEKVQCGDQLSRWQVFYQDLIERKIHLPELVLLGLRIWHSVAMLVVKAESYGPETRYDAFMQDFEVIVSSAEIIAAKTHAADLTSMFSYEIGYLIPVYVAATRCRDPMLRRRAITLLRGYPRQEGVVESTAAAALAEVWMNAEEEGLDVKSAADVPEERRLASTDLKVDVKRREAIVCLKPQDTGWQEDVVARWRKDETGKEPLQSEKS